MVLFLESFDALYELVVPMKRAQNVHGRGHGHCPLMTCKKIPIKRWPSHAVACINFIFITPNPFLKFLDPQKNDLTGSVQFKLPTYSHRCYSHMVQSLSESSLVTHIWYSNQLKLLSYSHFVQFPSSTCNVPLAWTVSRYVP